MMRFFALMMILASALGPAMADPQEDYQRGVAAYEVERYEEAAKYYRKAAEQRLAEAQFFLGVRYTKGGRVVADVYAAAFQNIGFMMIDGGHARFYDGRGKRTGWCPR